MKQRFILLLLLSLIVSSCGMKSKKGLTDNYDKYSSEIIELKDYYNKIVPENYLVRIRYNSSDNIDLFVYQPTEDSEKRELLFQQWNLDIDAYEPKPRNDYDKKYHGKTNSLDIVKEKLNWTNQTFSELYEKLDNINCIGITNRNPTDIEYGFKGVGLFGYLIFDKNLNSVQQEKYSDNCSQLFYKGNVVLTYGVGVFGSECTPEFKRKN